MSFRVARHSPLLLLALCGLAAHESSAAQQPTDAPGSATREIGIIDLYGLNRVRPDQIRNALKVTEGTVVSRDQAATFREQVEKRVRAVKGVASAQASFVCCDSGRLILYVGVQEEGATGTPFHAAPTGAVRLDPDILQAGEEFDRAVEAAVERGNAQEDDSEGHSLGRDPAVRGVQEHFIRYADEHVLELRAVLRDCADAKQRALAAAVIGYVTDKQSVVADLVNAMSDPDSGTRNNAMRTLAVFTYTVPTATRAVPRVPYEPFIVLLNSLDWTDRNKAAAALSGLSTHRDPELFAQLRKRAMTPLVEMARWKSLGHASLALFVLGRMAGYSEEQVHRAITRDEREPIVRGALSGQ